MNEQISITNNFTQTQQVGIDLASQLHGGEVLCLSGDLGFGKTTFIQGLAKGLGITKRILSPTFIIMRTYEMQQAERNIRMFYHVDLYRMETAHDIEGLGLFDVLGKPDTIVAIEWPEKLGKVLPKKRIDIKFAYLTEEKRKITINAAV